MIVGRAGTPPGRVVGTLDHGAGPYFEAAVGFRIASGAPAGRARCPAPPLSSSAPRCRNRYHVGAPRAAGKALPEWAAGAETRDVGRARTFTGPEFRRECSADTVGAGCMHARGPYSAEMGTGPGPPWYVVEGLLPLAQQALRGAASLSDPRSAPPVRALGGAVGPSRARCRSTQRPKGARAPKTVHWRLLHGLGAGFPACVRVGRCGPPGGGVVEGPGGGCGVFRVIPHVSGLLLARWGRSAAAAVCGGVDRCARGAVNVARGAWGGAHRRGAARGGDGVEAGMGRMGGGWAGAGTRQYNRLHHNCALFKQRIVVYETCDGAVL